MSITPSLSVIRRRQTFAKGNITYFLYSKSNIIADTVLDLGWGKGTSFALSYLLLALLLFYAH